MTQKKKKAKLSMTEQFTHDTDPYASREAEKYEAPIASREYIMSYIGECQRPPTFKDILLKLNITDKQQKRALDKRLEAMIRDGQLILDNNRYKLLDEEDLLEGEVIAHPDGYGFLKIGHDKDDLYLSNYEMRKVFPGDIVKALAQPSSRFSKKLEAVIISIKNRRVKQLVGRVIEKDNIWLLDPDDKAIHRLIQLEENSKLGMKANQMVLVEILSYPTRHEAAKARVIEIIGDYHAPGVEIATALRRFQIPFEWSHGVLQEVEGFSSEVTAADKTGRLDLRHLPLVTIDGEDAKDFDDAVYCELLKNGSYRLIVAIADVSNYVKPNSELDKEAYLRGTSVYFPGKVIPMLPEVLSNGLCSLNPNVDRLCFICEAELDCDGKLQRYRFLPALMRSHARLTYTVVADILIHKKVEVIAKYKDLVPHLTNLHQLFNVLKTERDQRGAIDFDSTETMIEFDANLKIAAIHPVIRNDAHRLIEECMLVANVAAAHFCLKNNLPVLYRNHEPPPEDKLINLQEFLKPLGFALRRLPPTPKDLSNLLKKIHARPDKHVIQMVVLRSLSQAMYEGQNKGHFGLAYEQYAHFTSPIRRYPDLLLHRQLHYYLSENEKWQKFAADSYKRLDKKAKLYFKESKQNLVEAGFHCSSTERRADEATRDVTSWLKCEYMQDKIGMVFDGCISSVTNFGVFVELNEVYIEGLLHITDLGDDYYIFNEKQHVLIGERAGRKYRIGDQIKIRVARVDLDSRHIDFVLSDAMLTGSQKSNKARRPEQAKKPQQHRKNNKKHKKLNQPNNPNKSGKSKKSKRK